MIPWEYKNKWYIIDISYEKIYINNLLEDECYAKLKIRGVENYLNGFLYEDKYLYIYNYKFFNSSQIIIFDLINKNAINNIKVKNSIKDMLLWDNNYAIVLTNDDIYTFDIQKQKILNQFLEGNKNKYSEVEIIKIIKLIDLGKKCLILHKCKNLDLYESE